MSKPSILHLYPQSLSLNGERGNVLALTVRAEEYGFEVSVNSVELGQPLPKTRPAIVFIGSGTLSQLRLVLPDLKVKENQIHKWVAAGTKVIAVGVGFDLISRSVELESGEVLQGIQLTSTSHKITNTHLVGEVTASNGLSGFINSNRIIERVDTKHELAVVEKSDDKHLLGYSDGYSDGKVLASNIQGPLLPMNPKLSDEILKSVFGKLPKKTPKLLELDRLAKKAREAIASRVGS
jgi:CobQ-like glutamine amidotransferase family enzyme